MAKYIIFVDILKVIWSDRSKMIKLLKYLVIDKIKGGLPSDRVVEVRLALRILGSSPMRRHLGFVRLWLWGWFNDHLLLWLGLLR